MPEIAPPLHQTNLAVATTGTVTGVVKGSSGPPQGIILGSDPEQPIPVIASQKIRLTVNWTNAATGTGFTVACFRSTGVAVGLVLAHQLPAAAGSSNAAFEFVDSNVPFGTTYTFTLSALTIAGTAADIVASCNDFT